MTSALALDLGAIDWSQPWLAPWRTQGERVATQARRIGLVDALNAVVGSPIALRAGTLRFVDHAELSGTQAYEAFIARTACVPTRPNLHDFFNALAWLAHPALKRRLNELQADQLALAAADQRTRGPVRDAVTVFDENGALLRAAPVLIDALQRRDWQTLFVTERAAWAEARIELFGHALLEKLVQPRKAITAHAWVVPLHCDSMSEWLARSLTPQRLASKPFLPLPVLGVPGWWAANAAPGFYADTTVFRAP